MSHENQHKNLPNDQAKEGDKQPSITSAKTANENITAEPQAPSYEAKFHSFSSSSDSTATTSDDQPLLDLIKRVTGGGNNTESQGRAVSEFAIEDAAQGVVHTHRGAERLGAQAEKAATAEPAPRQSFLDGLKKIFDHASSPEEREQMQSAFSIDYMMRKAKEFIGDVQSLITGKPVAVEKLPYDPSTGADVQPLPFRPGEKDSQPVPMIIRERMSPDEPEAARSLGVQITEAVINAAGADAYNPSTGTLQNDAGGDTAEDKSAVPPRPPRPGEEDARQREEMIIRQQMSPGQTESLRLGGQFAQAAIDATGANAYNPNAGTLPIDSAGRPSTAEDRSTVRPHPPRPGEEDARREEMIIRQQMSPGESEARRVGGQFAQAAIDATGARPFRPGIDDAKVETLPYKPGDNDQPVQQIIREQISADFHAIGALGNSLSDFITQSGDRIAGVVQSALDYAQDGHKKGDSAPAKTIPPDGSLPQYEAARGVFREYLKHAYSGEPELTHCMVKAGLRETGRYEKLVDIADNNLPKSATQQQQEAYVKEIIRVNGLKPSDGFAPPDSVLLLPGHDGKGHIIVSIGGQTVTTDQSNTRVIDTGGFRTTTLTSDGEQHAGPGPSDGFFVQKDKNGAKHFFERPGSRELQTSVEPHIQEAHKHLLELAAKRISDPEDRLKFEVDMARFEQRAADAHLPPNSVVDTYKNIERLLSADHGAGHINKLAMIDLAEEVMSQAARPRTITQGGFKTCHVTAIEYHMYRFDPAEASRLVADVALTGRFKSSDGTSIDFNDGGILATNLNTKEQGTADGERTLATQLFNGTTVNLVYQKEGGEKKYGLVTPNRKDHGDSGERLFEDGVEIDRDPDLNDDQVVRAYRILTQPIQKAGSPEPESVWNQLQRRHASHEEIVETLKKSECVYICNADLATGDRKLVDLVHSEKEFCSLLQCLKEAGKLPVMLGVHTAIEPFYTDSEGEKLGGAGGPHVVTITNFQNPPGLVAIDNQWFSMMDHTSTDISLHQLYLSTLEPKTALSEMQQTASANRNRNQIDTELELDIARLRRRTEQTDDSDYGWDVAKLMKEAKLRWEEQKKSHTFNPAEQQRALRKFKLMRSNWQKDSERAFGEGDLNNWDRMMKHGRKSINDPQ